MSRLSPQVSIPIKVLTYRNCGEACCYVTQIHPYIDTCARVLNSHTHSLNLLQTWKVQKKIQYTIATLQLTREAREKYTKSSHAKEIMFMLHSVSYQILTEIT